MADTVTERGVGLHERMENDRKAAFPQSEATLVKRFRAYARGRNPGPASFQQIQLVTGLSRNRFSDNICRRILQVTSSRTEFVKWDVPDKTVQDFLDGIFVRNQVADLQYDVMWATLRDGNHALALKWEASDKEDGGGRVTLHRERWWDGNTGLFVAYSEDQKPLYALKEFNMRMSDGSNHKRRTVYFDDHIERYIQVDAGWRAYADLAVDDMGPGQQSWLKPDGSPLGIPIVHFPNGSDDDRPYGASKLDGGVLSFQDQINAIQYDISAASTMTGFQQTWSTGTTLEKDAEGNDKAPDIGPGNHWHADEPEAAFGVLPPGDLGQLSDAYHLKISAVSRMTATPVHFFTGDWPSGEALLRAEIDLVDESRKLGKSVGPPWSTVGHRSTEMHNAFSQEGVELNENALIRAIFADPARRDLQAMTAIAAQQVDYTSKRERLRMTGRSEDQIDKIIKEMEEESEAALEAQQSFFGGNPAATGIPLGPDER